mmetsp:Transcript_17399/g.39299  ORF Transcript_17399/g.39299 Transcript_17399/m.39299 type:complete len:87 (+) Transcript_17399:755-1015(+)
MLLKPEWKAASDLGDSGGDAGGDADAEPFFCGLVATHEKSQDTSEKDRDSAKVDALAAAALFASQGAMVRNGSARSTPPFGKEASG